MIFFLKSLTPKSFDGWLVNIENKLTPEEVPKLLDFVKLLKEKCGRVIWYDAVTIEGELKWQNGLISGF